MTINVSADSRLHDEARVLSFSFTLPLIDSDKITRLISLSENALSSIVSWVEEHNALIGHIKGFISWSDSTIILSTTGNSINITNNASLPDDSTDVTFGLTGILFTAHLHSLQILFEKTITGLLSSFDCEPLFSSVHECDEHCEHEH